MLGKLLLVSALAASSSLVLTEACAQAPKASGAWVGRWYVGTASVCRAKPERGRGGEQGLRVYTTSMAFGYESKCTIRKVTPRGAGVDVLQSCRAEGEEWSETEYLEVIDGKLKVTAEIEGKRETFSFNRCPVG